MLFPPNPPKSGEALRAAWGRHLIDWIKSSVVPRGDGTTTIVHGCTVSAKNNLGDTYNGYLKPVQTAANKIKIVDGLDIEAANCATVQINKFTNNIAAAELTITADCFIYLESVLNGDPATSATAEIKQSATYPGYEAGKEKTLISRVTFADSKITNFSQEPVPNHIIVWGTC